MYRLQAPHHPTAIAWYLFVKKNDETVQNKTLKVSRLWILYEGWKFVGVLIIVDNETCSVSSPALYWWKLLILYRALMLFMKDDAILQIRDQKRAALLNEKRASSGSASPPRVVVSISATWPFLYAFLLRWSLKIFFPLLCQDFCLFIFSIPFHIVWLSASSWL